MNLFVDRFTTRKRILSLVMLAFVSLPAGAQPLLGTEFKTVLGPFDAKELASTGVALDPEAVAALAPTAAAIRAAVANEIASLAISAAGTQYFFGPDRTFYVSGNLGSFFIEPPWTSGEESWSLGLNVTTFDFDAFNDDDLDDLFDFTAFVPGTGKIKVMESRYDLRGTLFTLSGTYGLAEHWDVGFVAPYVKLIGEGDWEYWFGTPVADFHESDEGISDILLRTKYELLEVEDLDNLTTWSVGADVKLPSGDEDKLLGTGDWGYRLRTLGGKRFGRIYPTVELGYYWAGVDAVERVYSPNLIRTGIDDNDFNALEFKAAVPINLMEEKWTVAVEYLGRRFNHGGSNRTAGDLGFSSRFKISDSFFVQGGVRFPLDETGLRADVIPTLGGELRF